MRKPRSNRSGRSSAFIARLPLAAAIHLACFAPAFAMAADQDQPATTTAPAKSKDKNTSGELQTITTPSE